MKSVEEQLADYWSHQREVHGPITSDEVTRHKLADAVDTLATRPVSAVRDRRWRYALAGAATILVGVAGLGWFDGSRDESAEVATNRTVDRDPSTTGPSESAPDSSVDRSEPTTASPDADPSNPDFTLVGEPGQLTWRRSNQVADRSALLISDRERFYLFGRTVSGSVDGFDWNVEEVPESVPVLGGEDNPLRSISSDAAGGKSVHLTIHDRAATVFFFDHFAGEVHETTFEFKSEEAPETTFEFEPEEAPYTTGAVAINEDGEAFVFVHDDPRLTVTAGYYSADGINWSEVPNDKLPTDAVIAVEALGDGFVAIADTLRDDVAGPGYWISDDGTSWSAIDTDRTMASLLSFGDAVLGYAWSASPLVYSLTTTGAFDTDIKAGPLNSCFGDQQLVAASALGIAALCPTETNPSAEIVKYTSDGIDWNEQELPFLNGALSFPGSDIQIAATNDRVLIKVNRELWIGTSSETTPTS